MMIDWYERSTKTLQLAGLAKSSQEPYTCMVRRGSSQPKPPSPCTVGEAPPADPSFYGLPNFRSLPAPG